MIKFFKTDFVRSFVLVLILIIIAYWGVWNGFFQQDEWNGLGRFYSLANLDPITKLIAVYEPLFRSGIAHFLPLLPVVNLLRYSLFGLNYEAYALFSIFLHIVSVVGIYFVIKQISKDYLSALIGSVFFAIMPNASQAVRWVGTSLSTQLALIFSLWGIIFWIKWLETNKIKGLFFSISFAIAAIFFKETALYLFFFLPFSYFYKNGKIDKRVLFLTFSLVLSYVALRFLVLFSHNSLAGSIDSLFSIFTQALQNYIGVVFRGLTQIFISQEIVYKLLQNLLLIINKIYKDNILLEPVFFEQSIVRPVIFIIGVFLLILIVIRKKYLYLGYLLTSFLPIAFISAAELSGLFLPSRDLYIPLVGAVGLIGELGARFIRKRRSSYLFLFLLYFLVNFYVLRYENIRLTQVGVQREQILRTIKNQNPFLSEKVVFLIESDVSYYGLPEKDKILPFQSGFGQTLLVWYASSENFPKIFFENDFLWDIKSQGYIESDKRGFGYFRDKEEFLKSVDKYHIASESVIGYKWHSQSNFLENVTIDLRRELDKREK